MRFFQHILLLAALFTLSVSVHAAGQPWGRIPLQRTRFGHIAQSNRFNDPLDIPNVDHWFSADYGVESDSSSTLAEDGDVVFFWLDRTSNANDAYQVTNAKRPVYQSGVNNNNFAVSFDGNDDRLDVPGDGAERESTYIMVVSFTGSNLYSILFGHKDGSDYYGSFMPEYSSASHYPMLVMGANDDNRRKWADPVYLNGNPHIIILYIAGTAQSDISSATLWVDGLKLSVTDTRSTIGPGVWDNLLLGGAKAGNYIGCMLSEFVIISGAITPSDQMSIEKLWANKYGYTLP